MEVGYLISLVDVFAAFGGGILASAVGALPAFIFAGVLVVAGMTDLAFGPWFGPHIAFAGAVAATAFAAKRGLETGKDILAPLIKLNDGTVLLMGGIFGALGYVVQKYLAAINTPTDTVALTVVITCVIARLIFGSRKISDKYSLPDGRISWSLIVFGLGTGLISGYIALVTKNPVLPFGIAAMLLIVLQFMGVGPVLHHIALPAAIAAAAAGNIWIGGLFGVLGALLGDFFARTVNGPGVDTHIDPPAVTIAILTLIVTLFLK
jgi:hypothetical protein